MNNEKKIAMQQQCINELEAEIARLKQENEALKQLIPNGTDIQPVKKVCARLQKELADVTALKKKYEEANETFKIIKKNYETEMTKLLSQLRGSVVAKSANKQHNG